MKKVKRAVLTRIFLEEVEQRKQTENLLALAREQLAEGVLREDALARQAEDSDQLRLVLERAVDALQGQVRVQETILREAGFRVDFLTGETVKGLPAWGY